MEQTDVLTFSSVFESFGNGTANETKSRMCFSTDRTVLTEPTESNSCITCNTIYNIILLLPLLPLPLPLLLVVCDHILWLEFSFSLALFVHCTLPIRCYPLVHSRGRSPIHNPGTRVVAVVPQPSANLSHQQTPPISKGMKIVSAFQSLQVEIVHTNFILHKCDVTSIMDTHTNKQKNSMFLAIPVASEIWALPKVARQ